MEKFCQSCGMPLTKSNQGTEVNNGKSSKYCNLCYKNGNFTQPDISFEQMKQIGLEGIDHGNNGAIKKFILKLGYPMQLKNLARWKK